MNLIVNFRIHRTDGSVAHESGAFDALAPALGRVGDWMAEDDTIIRVDVRDLSDPDRPVRTIASVVV